MLGLHVHINGDDSGTAAVAEQYTLDGLGVSGLTWCDRACHAHPVQ